ncbi:MAG: methyltransferase [Candidatus Sericytochromatia bacterium]
MSYSQQIQQAFAHLNAPETRAQAVATLQTLTADPLLPVGLQAQSWYYLAVGYAYTGAYSEAVSAFQKALSLPLPQRELGLEILTKYLMLLEQLNLLEAARQAVKAGLAYFPQEPGLLSIQARLEQQMQAAYPAVSNLENWKEMQAKGYFDTHQHYQSDTGLLLDGDDLVRLQTYATLRPDTRLVVIGVGYGRESVLFAPHVAQIYGIDVTPEILNTAQQTLAQHGFTAFTPVLAERWRDEIPTGIDLVYTVTVFQHLTKHMVDDYVGGLAERLRPGGRLVCQFMHTPEGTHDAQLQTYEPHVSWSQAEIERLATRHGLSLRALDTEEIATHHQTWWYWVCFEKPL